MKRNDIVLVILAVDFEDIVETDYNINYGKQSKY